MFFNDGKEKLKNMDRDFVHILFSFLSLLQRNYRTILSVPFCLCLILYDNHTFISFSSAVLQDLHTIINITVVKKRIKINYF